MFAEGGAAALLALRLDPAVFADGGAAALLAFRLDPAVFADGGAAAVLASRLSAAVFAKGSAAALLASRLAAAVFADGGAISVLVIRISVSWLATYHWGKLGRLWERRGGRSSFLKSLLRIQIIGLRIKTSFPLNTGHTFETHFVASILLGTLC